MFVAEYGATDTESESFPAGDATADGVGPNLDTAAAISAASPELNDGADIRGLTAFVEGEENNAPSGCSSFSSTITETADDDNTGLFLGADAATEGEGLVLVVVGTATEAVPGREEELVVVEAAAEERPARPATAAPIAAETDPLGNRDG